MASQPSIKIDRNVPAPARRGGRGNSRFPFADMKVGDSFYVEWGENALSTRSVLSNAIAAYKLRNRGTDFTSRKDDGGIRVWRLA